MAATVRLSTVRELRERGGPLFELHYEEIARNKGVMVLAPHWETYEGLEAKGSLFCLVAALDDQIVGYSVNIVADHHLHYRDLVYAQNDVLFVLEEHRTGRVGLQLIVETEAEARRRGCRLLFWHAKPMTALQSLLPRMGYGVQDVIFSKELA